MGIEIAPGLEVPDSELEFEFIRSPGPGGQNVNKVATALQLRFDAARSTVLDEHARGRLATLAGRRLTRDGWLIITAHRHRTQEANRRDALERLAELILQARVRPKTRRPTRPTRASRERRLEGKKQRTQVKRLRGKPLAD
ncbi:MAG: alternative ribosome rescue aminoacyl-tRNA hydrolase ArfB [Steroidobacteraceae bacterium]|jgi:ribosome-associated protein|nr:alternative ribosome rescue aminoacyl-tRNA hydrolase ArfB [Steroidobacteraceae bacterium]